MTYKQDCTLPDELLYKIAEQGLEALPELNRTIINTAMQIEPPNITNFHDWRVTSW